MIQLEEGPLPIPARRHDRPASSHPGSDHTHDSSAARASTAYPSWATSSLTIFLRNSPDQLADAASGLVSPRASRRLVSSWMSP